MARENSPFQHELTELPELSRISRFMEPQDNPRYIVKEITPEWIDNNIARQEPDEPEHDFLERTAARGQAAQCDFSKKSGIKTPSTQILVARNEQGDEVLYRVSEQVHGIELEEAIATGVVPEEKVKELVTSLFGYYTEKFANGEGFMADTQWLPGYRYGGIGDESEDSIILMDTDPIYGDGYNAVATAETEDNPKVKPIPNTGYYKADQQVACVLELAGAISELRAYQFMPALEREIREYMDGHAIRENPS